MTPVERKNNLIEKNNEIILKSKFKKRHQTKHGPLPQSKLRKHYITKLEP